MEKVENRTPPGRGEGEPHFAEVFPEQLAVMPVVKSEWSHDHADYDIWLSASERLAQGLVWLFHCKDHDKWYVLAGTPATVHGSWKKQWRQGVIKLPKAHKECSYETYTTGEWEVKVEDPLSLIQPPITYGFSGWNFMVGGLTAVFLASRKEGWKAVLEFSLGYHRTSRVNLYFAEGFINPSFLVEYEEALRLFERLLQEGHVPSVRREKPLEDRFSHLAKYDDPREAFAVL